MKLLLIGVAMVILGAIFGNPVPWALFNYTEYHTLARYIGMVSAYVFLGGFLVILFSAGYYRAKANEDQRKIDDLLKK